MSFFFFQAEDGIRDLVRSRGLGDCIRDSAYGFGGDVTRGARSGDRVRLTRRGEVVTLELMELSLIHI